jgi:hypothetical protein
MTLISARQQLRTTLAAVSNPQPFSCPNPEPFVTLSIRSLFSLLTRFALPSRRICQRFHSVAYNCRPVIAGKVRARSHDRC